MNWRLADPGYSLNSEILSLSDNYEEIMNSASLEFKKHKCNFVILRNGTFAMTI